MSSRWDGEDDAGRDVESAVFQMGRWWTWEVRVSGDLVTNGAERSPQMAGRRRAAAVRLARAGAA